MTLGAYPGQTPALSWTTPPPANAVRHLPSYQVLENTLILWQVVYPSVYLSVSCQ